MQTGPSGVKIHKERDLNAIHDDCQSDSRIRGGCHAEPRADRSHGAVQPGNARRRGVVGGEGLQGSSKGARIVSSGGQKTVVDGPFPETKELIAGYWMLKVNSRDEAINGR